MGHLRLLLVFVYLTVMFQVNANIVRDDSDMKFEGEFSVVHAGRIYNVLRTLKGISLQECCFRCISYLSCRTVNYNEDRALCELVDEEFSNFDSDTTALDWKNYGTQGKVHGNWGGWQKASCSTSCSHGVQLRFRYCDSPRPTHGGSECTMADRSRGMEEVETVKCYLRPCCDLVKGNGVAPSAVTLYDLKTKEECITACIEQKEAYPGINGVSIAPDLSRCHCDIGATGEKTVPYNYESCIFT